MPATHDPIDVIGHDQDAEAQAKAAEIAALQDENDLKWLMGHKQGRRIAQRVLSQAHVHRTSFNTNASVTAFNEGERNVGLWLLAQILTTCPDTYMKMLDEHK